MEGERGYKEGKLDEENTGCRKERHSKVGSAYVCDVKWIICKKKVNNM